MSNYWSNTETSKLVNPNTAHAAGNTQLKALTLAAVVVSATEILAIAPPKSKACTKST
ncbi:hypothetical protein II941_01795 [bacterium]|nr:hypothetical protein [bacterium]